MNEDASKKKLSLISGILAGVVFILLFIFFQFSFLVSLAGAVVAFVAGLMVFQPFTAIDLVKVQLKGVTNEELKEVLKEGLPKYQQLLNYAKTAKDARIKQKISDIAGIAKEIFDDFKKDPKDIRVARQFLNYYLDATLKILARYEELSGHSGRSKELNETLERVDKLLSQIKAAFQAQLTKLLDNDIMDLKTEVDLMEKTLNFEGLGGEDEK